MDAALPEAGRVARAPRAGARPRGYRRTREISVPSVAPTCSTSMRVKRIAASFSRRRRRMNGSSVDDPPTGSCSVDIR